MNLYDLPNEILHQVLSYVSYNFYRSQPKFSYTNFSRINYSPRACPRHLRTDLRNHIRSLGRETYYHCVSFQNTYRKYRSHICTMTSILSILHSIKKFPK